MLNVEKQNKPFRFVENTKEIKLEELSDFKMVEHSKKTDTSESVDLEKQGRLTHLGMNDYGRFYRAYTNIDDAKRGALKLYQFIYGYAISYVVTSKSETKAFDEKHKNN